MVYDLPAKVYDLTAIDNEGAQRVSVGVHEDNSALTVLYFPFRAGGQVLIKLRSDRLTLMRKL
jgi:hypothetical protein